VHEFSLMVDLMRKIESVTREQGAGRVSAVKVRVGAISHISPEHLREHFAAAARGTVADGAELVVETGTDATDRRAQEVWLESVTLAE
jgi:hydrogenase nickel incorporation protein HypA/HybF